MHTKRILILALCASLFACLPVPTGMPPDAPERESTLTIPSPLPSTLTPIPTIPPNQTQPTALFSMAELSSADNVTYQEALSDIPVYRQGNMQLTILDKDGNPLPGYQIKYRQISHDFLFGGISDNFSTGALRQAGVNTWSMYMAWNWIQPEYGKFTFDFANYWLGIEELKSGGMTIRSNALYLLSVNDMPPFYRNVSYEEFLRHLYEHESAMVKRFAPSVDYWEAVLEPNFGNHNPFNLTKDQYYEAISTSIRAIHDNDPDAIVEINLSYPCGGIDWLDNFQITQEMLDRNIDFDVLGLQFYYNAYIGAGNSQMPNLSLADMSACYDKYETMLAPYNKKVVGAEFSVPSEAPAGQTGYWNAPWSEETQAQYLATVYSIFFSKPNNLGLVWWNTVEPSPFVYHGGLIKEDGTPKKSYYALQQLIQGWTTTGTGMTDSNGVMSLHGFGGEYEIEVSDPNTGESMTTRLHVTEQQSVAETISFYPNQQLLEQKEKLEKLVAYWEVQADDQMIQKGHDDLALVNHHLENSEWALAQQTLDFAFDELAISTEIKIPLEKFMLANQQRDYPIMDGGAVIWGADTLYFAYDFPPGEVTVEIQARAQSEKGEFPYMVAGVGANYSQRWKVENSTLETYTYSTSTTGDEQVLTIRFPYIDSINANILAQNGDVGELKLFVDAVKIIIKTVEIP